MQKRNYHNSLKQSVKTHCLSTLDYLAQLQDDKQHGNKTLAWGSFRTE